MGTIRQLLSTTIIIYLSIDLCCNKWNKGIINQQYENICFLIDKILLKQQAKKWFAIADKSVCCVAFLY